MNLKFWQNLSSEPFLALSKLEDLLYCGISQSCQQLNNFVSSIALGLEKLNMDLDTAIVNLDQIHEAYAYLKTSPHVVRTPVLPHVQNLFQRAHDEDVVNDLLFKDLSNVDLYLKMENMQTTGSFKIRGVINQMHKVQEKYGKLPKLVTMSAGNYGKAFAHAVGKSGTKSVCVMPKTAPQNRSKLIEKMGVEVSKTPTSELQSEVDRLVAEEDFVFCHPFDDVSLIAGYASSALEVLEDVPDPDVVVVCCGGGGLVSGVGAGIALSGHRNCRVYAVEPDGAPAMFESFKARRPIILPEAKSVAAGLAPPYAGTICYRHCRWFVEDILLVSDEEILRTMRLLFNRGIKAEPSGCAALAAVLSGKVPDIEGKKVVVYISGGNVTCSELAFYMKEEV